MMLRMLVVVLVLLRIVFGSRFSTRPQKWLVATGTRKELLALGKEKESRVTSIELVNRRSKTLRYTAILVENAGENAIKWKWFDRVTFEELNEMVRKGQGTRVIDLESYFFKGKQVYSAIGVPNVGESGVVWFLNVNVRKEDVAKALRGNRARAIDLDRVEDVLGERFDFVSVRSRGKSVVFFGKRVEQVDALIARRKLRLIDVERGMDGLCSGIMEKENGVRWMWYKEKSQNELVELAIRDGLRLYDLESYKIGSKTVYDGLAIENRAVAHAIQSAEP